MELPSDTTKFTYNWRLVEVARYIDSAKKVIREKRNSNSLLLDISEVPEYAKSNKNIRNIYIYMAL